MSKFGKDFFQISLDLLCVMNLDGSLIELNPQWKTTLEWTFAEFHARPFLEFIHADDIARIKTEITKLSQSDCTSSFEMRFLHKDGTYRWQRWYATSSQKKKVILITVRDISNERAKDFELESLKLATKGSKMIIWSTDLRRDLTWRSEGQEELLGYSSPFPEWTNETFFSHVLDKDQADLREKQSLHLTSGKPFKARFRIQRADRKEVRSLEIIGRTLRDSARKPTLLIQIMKDITDDLALENRLQFFMDSVQVGIWEWDDIACKLVWDQNLYRLYEVNPSDFSGAYEAWEKTIHPEDKERYLQELKDALAGTKPFDTFFKIILPNGNIRHIGAKASVERFENGIPWKMTGINWDATEKKKGEQKVIQSSKMASLGEMASGIAHEINNPLTIIYSKANRLKRQVENDSIDKAKFVQEIGKIEETVRRIAKIIRGLRAFSRNSEQDPMSPTKISTILEDTLELCQERFKEHNIDLKVSFPIDIEIECRPAQISQVLMNLLSNAHDAVQNLEKKWVRMEASVIDSHIQITVIDSGLGIPESVVDRMMQPFFTTKEVGRGTGLGLSISKGISEEHQGTLKYDETAANTTFILNLPISQPEAKMTKWYVKRT